MPPSCALLGRFAITAPVALVWQHNTNVKCQRVHAWLSYCSQKTRFCQNLEHMIDWRMKTLNCVPKSDYYSLTKKNLMRKLIRFVLVMCTDLFLHNIHNDIVLLYQRLIGPFSYRCFICKFVAYNCCQLIGILVCSWRRSCRTSAPSSLKRLKTSSSDVTTLSPRISSMRSSWLSCRSSLEFLLTFLGAQRDFAACQTTEDLSFHFLVSLAV